MKKIISFIKSNRHAFIWTVCYIGLMWLILRGLFNFDMFSKAHWVRLAHARLHGFPGFVFGIMVLAALPLYIASTTLIMKKKEPLFKVPLPKFMQPVSEEKPIEPEPESVEEPEPENFPDTFPAELRVPFLRARDRIKNNLANPTLNLAKDTNPQKQQEETPVPELETSGTLPLPTDFNFDVELEQKENEDENYVPKFTPVFQDLDFEDEDKDEPDESDLEKPDLDEPDLEFFNTVLWLNEHGYEPDIKDGVITTKEFAVAVHADSDFWVADEENWFASGKTKVSPIKVLSEEASSKKIKPILYLAETNILNLESKRTEWEKEGIKVITSLDEIN